MVYFSLNLYINNANTYMIMYNWGKVGGGGEGEGSGRDKWRFYFDEVCQQLTMH